MSVVKGFIFDYTKCVGCHACIVACSVENNVSPPLSWRKVNHFNSEKIPLYGFIHQSIACNHCADAPCMKACPSSSFSIDKQTDAVIHDLERCLGCKYCTWACPFDAPKYNADKGIIEKCHLCYHLLKEGKIPACALNCPTGALSFGEIEEKPHPEAIGFSEKKIYPRIKVIGSDVVNSIPDHDINSSGIEKQIISKANLLKEKQRINPLHEWPLVIFTFTCALITGWLWAGLFPTPIKLNMMIFATIGSIGMILSTLHLGKPYRAYLSIINLKSSWLSREILFFIFMIIFGIVAILSNNQLFLYIACIAGLLLVISIEMIYQITFKKFKIPLHSASILTITLTFTALLSQSWGILIVILALKTLLFSLRWRSLLINPSLYIVIFSFIRLIIGFAIPFTLLGFSNNFSICWLATFIILGELIARFLYYNDIELESHN